MGSSLGKLFTITSFGESHGRSVGITIDGCPAGLEITENDIQQEVNKRKPEGVIGATSRSERDKVEILSGVFNGFTTGAPICLLIWNEDTNAADYERIRFHPRPGHADYTAFMKYGGFNDFRGGGRFSGRITAAFVMAGAVAKKLLALSDIEVVAHTVQIGNINAKLMSFDEIRGNVVKNSLRCADSNAAAEMTELITQVREQKDSIGGTVEGIAVNIPVGLGEPVFDTLEGELSKALFAIPAVKGVEFGSGFAGSRMKGSENNDPFIIRNGRIVTVTNNAGGILGGISNAMPIVVRVAVKPTSSIPHSQNTVNLKSMENTTLSVGGRHDVCIVPRAVMVVEAMMAIVLCDFLIRAGLTPRVIK